MLPTFISSLSAGFINGGGGGFTSIVTGIKHNIPVNLLRLCSRMLEQIQRPPPQGGVIVVVINSINPLTCIDQVTHLHPGAPSLPSLPRGTSASLVPPHCSTTPCYFSSLGGFSNSLGHRGEGDPSSGRGPFIREGDLHQGGGPNSGELPLFTPARERILQMMMKL